MSERVEISSFTSSDNECELSSWESEADPNPDADSAMVPPVLPQGTFNQKIIALVQQHCPCTGSHCLDHFEPFRESVLLD
jgi:hypothetical protein